MKKLHTKKRRINSKKGISMVLAIALAAVLFLSTTTFLSIAMLQQKETGTTMNSRQAYVSAKSALDMAEELLNDGKLQLPDSGSLYYVFYYVEGDPKVHVEKFNSSELALEWINNPAHASYTIIGNAYIKITKNTDGSYTMTAVGKENKYDYSGDGNTGDLSTKFDVKYNLVEKEEIANLTMKQKTITSPTGNKFLMLGDQTSFSLLRSVRKTLNEGDTTFRTLQSYDTDNEKKSIIYIPKNEAGNTPLTTCFPLVFDKTVKSTSNGDSRLKFTAYDNGIYFLGNYTGPKITSDYNSEAVDVSFYTNSDAYGTALECKYLVIGGNMVCRPATGESGITLKYSGSSYDTDKGVVIYFTKNCKLMTYNNSNQITKTVEYKKGYYYINLGDNNTAVDLFSESTKASAKEITTNSEEYKRVNSIDMYSSMVDTKGKLKDIHSAYEGEYEKGKERVDILNESGTFTAVPNSNSYSNTVRTEFTKGWKDYYIYCAPSEMPTASGYYDMYSGKEFNYLWYNINPMEFNGNVDMSIHSSNITLSIGPDENETVYYNNQIKNSNGNPYFPYSFNQTILPTDKFATDSNTQKFTAEGSNKITQKNSSASFSVKPYWNEKSFTLKVVNDFIVEMSDGTTYTIKADDYTDIPETGLNLFTDEAKKYFESHSTSRVDSNSSSIEWVKNNTINTSVDSSNLDQSSSVINFKATNGGTLKGDTYKGKAIYCDFGNGSSGENAIVTYGNNATLKADVVSIGADLLEIKDGKGLKINTYSAHNESTCVVDGNPIDGSMLQITRKTTLKFNDDNANSITLSPGYYFFPGITGDFDILSKAFWENWSSSKPYYKAEKLNDGTEAYKKVTVTTKIDPVDFEGKYF
jgi:Tfp pilus assembly protein PilX